MRAVVYNSNTEYELGGPVKLVHDPVCGEALKVEGALEAYTERMTMGAAAFTKKVEEILSSDFVDVVHVQTPDLHQDENVLREIRGLIEPAEGAAKPGSE